MAKACKAQLDALCSADHAQQGCEWHHEAQMSALIMDTSWALSAMSPILSCLLLGELLYTLPSGAISVDKPSEPSQHQAEPKTRPTLVFKYCHQAV